MTSEKRPSSVAEGFTWTGLVLVLTPLLFRAMTQTNSLPYWDMDPLLSWSPMVGIGPAGSLAVDALIILGSGLLLMGTASKARGSAFLISALLVAVGVCPIIIHGWFSSVFTLGQQRIGASWASAMIAGLALWHAGADRRIRIVSFAAIIGLIGMLAVRGVEQVFIEHPGVVENYKQNKEAILAANGWTPDSSMARGYERRLMQAEATGWFGLSNVYASFAAAGVVAFAALAWNSWQLRRDARDRSGRTGDEHPNWPLAIACVGALASICALVLAGSKGGFVACAIGVGVLAVGIWCARQATNGAPSTIARLSPLVGPSLVAAALLGVIARGVVGERIGELSLLFRWFYMQAASRIAIEHWGIGVGPDGFKDAYLIFKNPLSPEEVGSPHSILFDWWACLGIFGLAWIALWLWWLFRAGRASLVPPASPVKSQPAEPARPLIRAVATIASIASLAAMYTETAALLPEAVAIRIAGLLLSIGLSIAAILIAARDERWTLGLGAAAIVFAVHGQIEVTGSLPQSAGLFVVLIALAASRSRDVANEPASDRLWARGPSALHAAIATIGVVIAINAGLLAWRGVWPAWRWERGLALAAEELRPVGETSQWLQQYQATRSAEALEAAQETIRRALANERMPSDIREAIQMLARLRLASAITRLAAIEPLDWHVTRERTRLRLLQMHEYASNARTVEKLYKASDELFEDLATISTAAPLREARGSEAARDAWVSSAMSQAAALLESAQLASTESWRASAYLQALSAQARDPFNLPLARRVLTMSVGDRDATARLRSARRVLELDDLQRLDRAVRGLTPSERREVEDLVKHLETAPKPTPTNP